MQLLNQTLDGKCYTVRIWRDEVAPDAVDTYNWIAWTPRVKVPTGGQDENGQYLFNEVTNPLTKAQYEAQMVVQAKSLSALQVPVTDPTVVTENTQAISDQQVAVDAMADAPIEESVSNE